MQSFRLGAGIAMALLVGGIAVAQPAKPTDPQIAHIAYTAGVIDVTAAELALQKSQNPQVRSFAEDMVRDHKAVNEQASRWSRSSMSRRRTMTPAKPWQSRPMRRRPSWASSTGPPSIAHIFRTRLPTIRPSTVPCRTH